MMSHTGVLWVGAVVLASAACASGESAGTGGFGGSATATTTTTTTTTTTASTTTGGGGGGGLTTGTTGGGGGGGGTSTGGGGAGGCATVADCPPPANECAAAACTSGACGMSFVAQGTATAMQTAGDCQESVCDGAGNVTSVADDTDVPDDGNACTVDLCTNGVPSHTNVSDGTACAMGHCVAGTCVQCEMPTDCPPATSDCSTPTCSAGMCGFDFAPAGTPCSQGGVACDGAGTCAAPPVVTATGPADGAMAVAGTTVGVVFSAVMAPTTLTAQTTAGPCSGSVQVSLNGFVSCVAFASAMPVMSGGGTTATFTPAPGLLVNRTYQVRVTTAAKGASGLALAAAYTSSSGFGTTSPDLCDGSVVISQVYGGGGNSGAVWTNDFVELLNRGSTAVDLTGWSVQYTSANGAGTWLVTTLSGTIMPGAYHLVEQAKGAGGTMNLPTPDATGTTAMSSTGGKVALMRSATALSGMCPGGASLVDFVAYGATNCSQGGTPTPALTNTTAAIRVANGCGDVGVNGTDFTAPASGPTPRNSASPAAACACTVQNESGAAAEADYCDTQSPLGLSVTAGATTPSIFGRLDEMGTTGMGAAAATVRAQLGFGPLTANPEYEAGWTWVNASYNAACSGCGNDDEYMATFTAPAAGTYGYVYRVSLDQGTSWTYCDADQGDTGAGSGAGLTFDLENEAILTVQ